MDAPFLVEALPGLFFWFCTKSDYNIIDILISIDWKTHENVIGKSEVCSDILVLQ